MSLLSFLICLLGLPILLLSIPDPYKILKVSRDATEKDIRSAFRNRARKYHPDSNSEDPKAKEKFTKIVNAYDILKDAERRRHYDMTGEDQSQQQGGGGGNPFGFQGGFVNLEDIMGGFGGFGGGGGGGKRAGGQRQFTFSFGGQRFDM